MRVVTKSFWPVLLLYGFLSLLIWPAQATASENVLVTNQPMIPLSQAVSVFRNSGDPLTLQALLAQQNANLFTPTNKNNTTNFGLTQDEIWLRLELHTTDSTPDRWFLEIKHPSLDVIECHIANQKDGIFTSQLNGDLVAFNQKPYAHFTPIFELQLQSKQQYVLYVKVKSQGTVTVPLKLWQPDALWQADQRSYAFLSLYYGILFGLLVYNLFIFFSLRDPIYLIYVAFIGFLGLGQAGLSGLSYQFLLPDSVWLANLIPTTATAAAGIFGSIFAHRFLGNTLQRLHLNKLMLVYSLGFIVICIVSILGHYHLAAMAVNLWGLLFALSALILGSISLYLKQPGSRFFVLAWISLLTGIIVITLHNIGVLPTNFYTINSLWIGSAIEMLLLAMALADRINELQNQHQTAQAQALHIKQEMINAAKENERLLESRVESRTQELALVNQQLLKSEQQLIFQANHDPLTQLANRNLLQQKIQYLQAQGEGFAVIVADLDKFKPINDQYGHAAGDQVLLTLAERLKIFVEDADWVARVGGDEFILILPHFDQKPHLQDICAELQTVVSQPITLKDGTRLTITVSVGFAIYPDDADSLDTLLSKADDAMYQHKNSKSFN
ncbi:sensor domain-containing diguanylate cyclase [Hydrogenovibrio sp. SC-1]|uniref:diguanylate cyclase n=1 Tax=Hydrogenovibrio sp. SC-1 TaxID=2065820 RepID=UPI000C7B849A|nr:diguanylate cyclase [Hydrogenovibrio sp. SC-1]PLA75319.1 sensor domain-containing diguanylate cyclase [Hydrogenovibrio sp. SC-1]